MTDNNYNEEVGGIINLADMIGQARDGKKVKAYEKDGTLVLGNSNKKKDVEIGDTLAREFGDGFRDLKVSGVPTISGYVTMSDGSKEPTYLIEVRRRRLDLGE